ncbi:hypothetical protein H8S33_00100 [Ornithinibacillus sp. BX22]|uniref:Thioredoxin-like fold domain-containing protein n=2 Tax=Ornithinibacillus TaxID=484508 RepID=A0A923L2E2_9BACI|nr:MULTISPECIES: hypothetical protein [Ornithinibacillus]MBC5635214.1 hypothetical protein [Ornithinibacillus hominis]MBS3678781.1 hypothetical protein [Ornithinibacillus massiliensis]
MGKTIEIFTDSSRFSNDLENQVKNYACSRCSILVYDASNPETTRTMDSKVAAYNIATLPAVSIDGKVVPLDKLKKGRFSSLVRQFWHNN